MASTLVLRTPLLRLVTLLMLALTPTAIRAQESVTPAAEDPFGADALDNLANVDFRADVRVFTTMAALNVAGFNFEVPNKEMSSIRQAVRHDLGNVSAEIKLQLQAFYSTRRYRDPLATHTAFTSLALLLDGPPTFKIREDAPNIPEDVQRIQGFEELLPAFYQQAQIEQLWPRYRQAYEEELRLYRPVMRTAIRSTLEYFRIPARIVLDRQIVLMPDLLSFRDVVHARNLEKIYLIVVGPAENPESNFTQLQHEYLHFLIDPIVEKHGGELLEQRDLLNLAHKQPNLSWDFRNRFLLIVGESLIEALLAEFHPPESLEEASVEVFRRGMIFTPYFQRALKDYSKQTEVSLPEFLETAFGKIQEGEILSDKDAIDKLEAKLQAGREAEDQRQAELQQAEELRVRQINLLASASRMMAANDFDGASQALNDLLELDGENGTAKFYLAQIAAQKGDQEAAFALYDTAASSSKIDDWARAWAVVRLGRYLAFQGKFQEARAKFEQVLSWDGDLKGAQEEARESISHLPESEQE